MRDFVPLSDKRISENGNSYNKSYQAKQTKSECEYCEKPDHRKTVKTMTERRKILSDKKLYRG